MIPLVIEASARIAVIAVVVGLVLSIVRVRSGAVRHAAWSAVVATMLASPILATWRPNLPVEVPRVETIAEFVEPMTLPEAAVIPGESTEPRLSVSAPLPTPLASAVVHAADTTRSGIPWTSIVGVGWAMGFLILFGQLVAGWRLSRRLAATCTPISPASLRHHSAADGAVAMADGVAIDESPLVAAPITMGVLRSRIVLPTSWTAWTPETLSAVLTHEAAHVRRHDTLVSLLARINRCVFWFHPLAWWLERAVATTAEQACDDIVVQRTRRTQRYAELLVAMADSVRAHGGRVAWHGVGIGGSGRLSSRIDRVLRGDGLRVASRGHVTLVALGCAIAITAGVACQQQPEALRPDPELAAQHVARQAAVDASVKRLDAAVAMTPEQVAALEARVAADPDDLETTEDLLNFYRESGQKVFGWNEMIVRRRPHLLRVIERHPESALADSETIIVQAHDPEGYARAKALWLAHVGKPTVTAKLLGNAAVFFQASDKPRAEELLLRAQAMEPTATNRFTANGLFSPSWTSPARRALRPRHRRCHG